MTFNEWKSKYIKNESTNPAQNLFMAFDRWLGKTPKAWKTYLALPTDEKGNIVCELRDVFNILEQYGVEFPTEKK